jgi:hypothetical protein
MMAAAVVGTVVLPTPDPLHRAAVWGVVLLASFAGWGGLVARFAFPRQRADLGLRLAWGMAAMVGAGGGAMLVSLATRPTLLLAILVGVGAACRDAAARGGSAPVADAPGPRRRAAAALAFVAIAIPTTIQWYGGAAGTGLTVDDFAAYLVFPEKILATGTLIEPFSLHRLAAYGGQSLLHALTRIGTANALQMPVLDAGLCLAVVLALVLGARDARAPRALHAVPTVLVLTLPAVRANTTSLMSGVVFFLALYRTATWRGLDAAPRRAAVVLGMLAAAAATLRPTNLAPAALFLALLYAPAVLRARGTRDTAPRAGLAGAVIAFGAMAALVLPWALLSQRSSGTPLFPLLHGNYQVAYEDLTAAHPSIDRATFFWINLRHCHPVLPLPLFFLAAVATPWASTRGALTALACASAFGFAAVVYAFPLSDEFNLSRYYFPFAVATTFAVATHACALPRSEWRSGRLAIVVPAALALLATAVQVSGMSANSYQGYRRLVAAIRAAAREPSSLRERDAPYRALQASVPVGAPLLTMVDEPFWLDFRRNPIQVLDMPGHVSPPPGVPLADDEALVAYFAREGFRYLAFVRPTASSNLYRRDKWTRMIGPLAPPLWRKAAPRYLQLFDRLESLAASRVRLHDDGKMVVLDLAGRRR